MSKRIRSLELLRRVAEQKTDEKRQELLRVRNRLAQLEQDRSDLGELVAKEIASAQGDLMSMRALAAFEKRSAQRARELDLAVQDCRIEEEQAVEEVRQAVGDVKRFDVVIAKMAREEASELNLNEQKFLDWIAGRRAPQ
jgi:hypothetical protein